MVRNQAYSSFADFEREEIRPGMRIGWSVDELEDDFDFDSDLFEEAVWDSDEEDEEQESDED
jgi:hypothetical protein